MKKSQKAKRRKQEQKIEMKKTRAYNTIARLTEAIQVENTTILHDLEFLVQLFNVLEHPERVCFRVEEFRTNARKPKSFAKAYNMYKKGYYYKALGLNDSEIAEILSRVLSFISDPMYSVYDFYDISDYYDELRKSLDDFIERNHPMNQ